MLFGVAGNPPGFWSSAHAGDRLNALPWLAEIGLDSQEIQCTRGVRIGPDRAAKYREASESHSITLSIHGPYYISLGNPDEGVVENSLNELAKSVELAKQIGSQRVVFHLGALRLSREDARALAIDTLHRLPERVDLESVRLYPEVIGKVVQFGSLKDVLEICRDVSFCQPCIDFGHLHARTNGSLVDQAAFARVFDELEQELGGRAYDGFHCHMYPIEWGPRGEIRHRAFDDRIEGQQLSLLGGSQETPTAYLPRPEPFLAEVIKRDIRGVVICEAKDTQDQGALLMKGLYHSMGDRP